MRRRRKASRFQPAARKPDAASYSDISHNSVHAIDPGPAQMVSTEPQDLRDAHAIQPSQAVPEHAMQQSYLPAQHSACPTNSSSLGAAAMEKRGKAPPRGFLAKLAQYRSS